MASLPAFLNQQNLTILLAVLLGISEALANIPAVKANSIFELIVGILKKLSGQA